ncbi:ATPase [Arcticibacter eurypsychrophilus]|uniref:ATPase n=1 Tax=Arcticibacter eurypsychrophilus TaxID=1434752 RepID=UPI00084E055E|nr:ATPase [Arcticibacter eurypsychrophilus]
MERQAFKISINSSPEKIRNILWSDVTYPLWTAPFAEGSKAKTDWKKGSIVLFLDGNDNGMISTIEENIPNKFMSIKHLGSVKNGVEDLNNPDNETWVGALENYTLNTENERTELLIDMDITDDFKEYMQLTWPKALDKVKELAESSSYS